MTRRTVVAGLAAGAVLAMGCVVGGSADGDAAPTPAGSVDAATTALVVDLLRAGTAFVDETSFRTDVDVGGQVTTVSYTDNVNRRARATVSNGGQEVEVRMIDDEVYLRVGWNLPGVGEGWMVLDPARVPPDFALSFDPGRNDPGGSARLINGVVSAQVSDRDVTGTLDLTRVGEGNGIAFRPGPGGTWPDSARSQPFHATFDGEDRLVSFVVPPHQDYPGASLRYGDFGLDVDVTAPRRAVPAPDALYPQLGLP